MAAWVSLAALLLQQLRRPQLPPLHWQWGQWATQVAPYSCWVMVYRWAANPLERSATCFLNVVIRECYCYSIRCEILARSLFERYWLALRLFRLLYIDTVGWGVVFAHPWPWSELPFHCCWLLWGLFALFPLTIKPPFTACLLLNTETVAIEAPPLTHTDRSQWQVTYIGNGCMCVCVCMAQCLQLKFEIRMLETTFIRCVIGFHNHFLHIFPQTFNLPCLYNIIPIHDNISD